MKDIKGQNIKKDIQYSKHKIDRHSSMDDRDPNR